MKVIVADPLPDRPSLQGLVNQVAGYGVGAVINRALGIIVACVYPMLLSKDEYGRLDVIFTVINLLLVVFYLGFDTLLPRFYYEPEDERERGKLVSTAFHPMMAVSILSVALLLLFSRPLASWLYEESRYLPYFRLMLSGMPFVMANSFISIVLRLRGRIRLFNILAVANLVIAALIGVSSILVFKIGAAGVLVGFISANAATGIAGLVIIRHDLAYAPRMDEWKKLLKLGLPLVISGAAAWLIGSVNRPILVHRVSAEELGLYAIASGAIGMLLLLFAAFRNAWQPFAFSIMETEGYRAVYGQALTLFTAVGAVAAAALTLFAPHVLLIINLYTRKNWSGAASAVGPLAMGAVFATMYFVVQTGVYIVRRTNVIAITMGIAAFVNLALNVLLIPYFGILGAAFATALGHLTALISVYLIAQRLAPVPYSVTKLTTTIVAAFIAIGIGSRVHAPSVLQDILLKLLILGGYCGILLASRAITKDDLLLFWNINLYGRRAENQPRG